MASEAIEPDVALEDLPELSSFAVSEIEAVIEGADSVEVDTAQVIVKESGKPAEIVTAYTVTATTQISESADPVTGETEFYMQQEMMLLTSADVYDSVSFSTGKYDVSYSSSIYYYVRSMDSTGLVLQAKLDAVTGKIVDAGTNAIYCNKLQFDGQIIEPSGWPFYYSSKYTVSNPTSGVTYRQSTVSGWAPGNYTFGSQYTLTFSNGTILEGDFVIR